MILAIMSYLGINSSELKELIVNIFACYYTLTFFTLYLYMATSLLPDIQVRHPQGIFKNDLSPFMICFERQYHRKRIRYKQHRRHN
jgi:hypothetical protein